MSLPPLYKYLDVHGAELTLGNRTFKHAKPSDFNDTQDLTVQGVFPEDTEMALKKLQRGFTDVILQHLNDPPTCGLPMREQVALIQHVYRTNPDAADIVKAEMNKDGTKPVYDIDYTRGQAVAFLEKINGEMQATRVLCVTTHKDSEKMWSVYAKNHKGIALRIDPGAVEDSKFKLFRPVIYRETRPPLCEDVLEFLADTLFGDLQTRVRTMLERIVYTKTLEWAYQNEYRLAIYLRQGEKPWNTDPYHPEEIAELYLGLAMEKADTDRVVGMALAVNPDIAIFRARRGPDGALGFDPV